MRLSNGMLGPDVVRAARAIEPVIRAIYMTGYADPHEVGSDGLASDSPLIKKPFRSDDFALMLERVRSGA